MRQKLSLLLLIGLTAIVVGCKLAVIVVVHILAHSDHPYWFNPITSTGT